MSAGRSEQLVKLVEELLEEAERVVDGPLEDDTSLIESGLLDSVSLVQVADWVDEQMSGQLDLKNTNIAEEWDTIVQILRFIERSA
jgi:acyl carrier protein